MEGIAEGFELGAGLPPDQGSALPVARQQERCKSRAGGGRPVIAFKSRPVGCKSSPGGLTLHGPLHGPTAQHGLPSQGALSSETAIRDFVLSSSTQTIRRALPVLDMQPQDAHFAYGGPWQPPPPVSEAMSRDKEGQLRLNMSIFYNQQGRPVSPGASPTSKEMSSAGSVWADEEAVSLMQALPSVQPLLASQSGFLNRLRTPKASTRSTSGASPMSSLSPAASGPAPPGLWSDPSFNRSSRTKSLSGAAPGLAVSPSSHNLGFAPWARSESNPVAVALFQGPTEVVADGRPATASTVMGQATWLTSEEDVFHMASHLGILHPNAPSRSLSTASGMRRKPSSSSSPLRASTSSLPSGLGTGAAAAPLQRPSTVMASRQASSSASSAPTSPSAVDRMRSLKQPHHTQEHAGAAGGAHGTQHALQLPHVSAAAAGAGAHNPSSPRGRHTAGAATGGAAAGATASGANASGSSGGSNGGAASLPSQPLGVSLRVLRRLAEEVSERDPLWSSGEVVRHVILPHTQALRCRYTDMLPTNQPSLGPPQYFVSHSWKGNFVDMVTAIQQLLAVRVPKQSLDDTFLWIDILCQCQHDGCHILDLNLMRDILASCDRTLLVLDREASSLNRTVCLWEVWMTSCLDKFDKGRLLLLPAHHSWSSMTASYMLCEPSSSLSQTTWGLPSAPKDLQRRAMMTEMARGEGGGLGTGSSWQGSDVKEALFMGVKRELQRAEKVGNLSPRWLITAANTAAFILYARRCYSEADDTLRQAVRAAEKAPARTIPDADYVATKLHLAVNLAEKASAPEAELALQDILLRFQTLLPHEVYLDSMSVMATVQWQNRSYMRAEMTLHKALTEVDKAYGRDHPMFSRCLLQVAGMAITQRLMKQAEESAMDVLQLSIRRHPPLANSLLPITRGDFGSRPTVQAEALRPGDKRAAVQSQTSANNKASGGQGLRGSAGNAGVGQRPSGQAAGGGSGAGGQGAGDLARAVSMDVDDEDGPEPVLMPLLPPVGERPLVRAVSALSSASGMTGRSASDAAHAAVARSVQGRDHERALLDATAALHILAQCKLSCRKGKVALALTRLVLDVRCPLLGDFHPLTIETQYLQAHILLQLEYGDEACELLEMLGRKMVRTWGSDQPETVQAMAELADLHREMKAESNAEAVERDIIQVGKSLLMYPKPLDRVRHMSVLCTILASRDHLVDKASLLLAKTLLAYREKLGSEHKLTRLTRDQLLDIVEREKQLGARALNQAKGGDDEMFKVAEVMYKQALAIGKLVCPNQDQSGVAEGLADAQFGQGKIHEAQKTLKHNGLLKGSAKDGLPTSFLRFINSRGDGEQLDDA